MLVPRVTHQIWMQGWDQIPPALAANTKRLHELNPDFKHMQWTADSLRAECVRYGAAAAARYDSLGTMVAKVDFGRYVVLFNHGGISIDADMEPIRPLRDTPGLNEYDLMFTTSIYGAVINNATILVTPGHPMIRKMIDTIAAQDDTWLQLLPTELYVNATTGPVFINWFLSKHGAGYKYHLLGYEYYEPCIPSLQFFCSPGPKTIMNHRHTLSWFNGLFWLLVAVAVAAAVAGVVASWYWWSKHTAPKIDNDRPGRKATDMGGRSASTVFRDNAHQTYRGA